MLPLHLCPSALQSTRWPRLSLTAIFSQHSSTPPLYELDCYLFTITSCTSVTEFLPFTLSLTAQHAKKPFLSILIFPFLFASLVSHFSASPSHPRHIYIYISLCITSYLSQPDRYVINVSAMEGKFYRFKTPNHPHTNMVCRALQPVNAPHTASLFAISYDGLYPSPSLGQGCIEYDDSHLCRGSCPGMLSPTSSLPLSRCRFLYPLNYCIPPRVLHCRVVYT